MKNLSLFSLVSLSVAASFPMAGCKPEPSLTPEQQEQEVQRRVAQKLSEEKAAQEKAVLEQKAQDLDQKAQTLAQREQAIAQREQTAVVPSATAQPTLPPPPVVPEELRSRTEPRRDSVALRGVMVEDEVGGEPSPAYDRFYSELSGEGDWFEVPRYGLVWQPRAAMRDSAWRPYTLGHWAYTEDVGWTWMSHESFGWATYHYGRWAHVREAGWVWVPGTLWAPAWVSWRHSDDYVGWAPLPPEGRIRSGLIGGTVDDECQIPPSSYAFVATERFVQPDLQAEVVDPDRNATIVNRTVNITNIAVHNKTIVINRGPDMRAISARARTPVIVLKVTRRDDLGADQIKPARGGEIVVPAPFIRKSAGPVHLPALKPRGPSGIPRNLLPGRPVPGSVGPFAQPGHPVQPAGQPNGTWGSKGTHTPNPLPANLAPAAPVKPPVAHPAPAAPVQPVVAHPAHPAHSAHPAPTAPVQPVAHPAPTAPVQPVAHPAPAAPVHPAPAAAEHGHEAHGKPGASPTPKEKKDQQ